jgi:hypothetical protein
MSITSTDIYIKNQFQLKIMERIAMWFDDNDDASNWFFYQRLTYFGGMTAEEVLTKDAEDGYHAIIEYANLKELHKL